MTLPALPLSERQHQVAALYWGERMLPADIGLRLGMSRTRVWVVIRKAEAKLRAAGLNVPPPPTLIPKYVRVAQLSACGSDFN